ncbi:DUF2795 domain-containing protein [Spirillospora sp. CA-253888]
MANRPSFIEVQKSLAGVNYPADRDALVKHAQDHGADGSTLEALKSIPDREYDGPNAVSKEVSQAS